METLAKLFGGTARVKIMRLFMLNNTGFDLDEVATRSRVAKDSARKELSALSAMHFIKRKAATREGARR